MAVLMPNGRQQFFDAAGAPLVGGLVYTYEAGTGTPKDTFTDYTGGTPNTNPVILDARGEAVIFWDGNYKVVLQDSGGATIWTQDNYQSLATQAALDAAISENWVATYASLRTYAGTSATVSVGGRANYFDGAHGEFAYDSSDLSSADNDGTIIVDALGRRWKRQFTGRYNVVWFGATGNGIDDDYAAITAASIAAFGRVLHFPRPPSAYYNVSAPLVMDPATTSIAWEGDDAIFTRIRKTTNTVGSGTALAPARGGAITDTFAADAIIICKHPANDYLYHPSICNLYLVSQSGTNVHGVYIPRAAYLYMDDVWITGCLNGIYAHDVWMTSLRKVIVDGMNAAGSRGFRWRDDGSGLGTGTSLSANQCWAKNCTLAGWDIFGLSYSALTGCGSDNHNGGPAYKFAYSQIAMNGCGAEGNVPAASGGVLDFDTCQITINGGKGYNNTGASNAGMFKLNGGTTTLNDCDYDDWVTVNAALNMIIQAGAKLTTNNTTLPTNGGSFVSYGGGSSWTNVSTGAYTDATGTSYPVRSLASGVRTEKLSKAIGAGATDIFTITQATAGSTAHVSLKVYGNDTAFDNGAITQTVEFVFAKDGTPAYWQGSSIINSLMAGSAGFATPPSFGIARSGDTWTVSITPGEGAFTATMVAEVRGVGATPTFAWV